MERTLVVLELGFGEEGKKRSREEPRYIDVIRKVADQTKRSQTVIAGYF